jgi:hypothetical protein
LAVEQNQQGCLHVPEPPARPGQKSRHQLNFFSEAGEIPRPAHTVSASEIHHLSYALIRVLDDDDSSKGAWAPQALAEAKNRGIDPPQSDAKEAHPLAADLSERIPTQELTLSQGALAASRDCLQRSAQERSNGRRYLIFAAYFAVPITLATAALFRSEIGTKTAAIRVTARVRSVTLRQN